MGSSFEHLMYEDIFTSTGFGGTGSSAITDILGEFSNGKSLGDLEIWFYRIKMLYLTSNTIL